MILYKKKQWRAASSPGSKIFKKKIPVYCVRCYLFIYNALNGPSRKNETHLVPLVCKLTSHIVWILQTLLKVLHTSLWYWNIYGNNGFYANNGLYANNCLYGNNGLLYVRIMACMRIMTYTLCDWSLLKPKVRIFICTNCLRYSQLQAVQCHKNNLNLQ